MLLTIKTSKPIEVRSCFKVFVEANTTVQSDLNFAALSCKTMLFFNLRRVFWQESCVGPLCMDGAMCACKKKNHHYQTLPEMEGATIADWTI